MTIKNRAQTGKFAAKSETPRKVRSVNLTDAAWQWLARTAEEAGLSRNDLIEAMAGQQPVMETVQPSVQPVMETVQPSVQPIMETAHEIERLRQTLSATDRLLVAKNAAIAKLESELSTARQKILEADLAVDKLESELVSRQSSQPENSATVGTDLSKVEVADLLNQLRARHKKSKANRTDVKVLLDLLGFQT